MRSCQKDTPVRHQIHGLKMPGIFRGHLEPAFASSCCSTVFATELREEAQIFFFLDLVQFSKILFSTFMVKATFKLSLE